MLVRPTASPARGPDIRPQGLAWYKQMVAPLLCWLGMGVTPFQVRIAGVAGWVEG